MYFPLNIAKILRTAPFLEHLYGVYFWSKYV